MISMVCSIRANPSILLRRQSDGMSGTSAMLAATAIALCAMAHQPAFGQTCPMPVSPPPTAISFEPPQHEEVRAARIREIVNRLAGEHFDAIALGDSIVQRWPDDMLQRATGMSTLNAGILGDRTQYVLRQIAAWNWSAQQPRYVLLLIGTNNLADSTPCDVYWGIRADIRAIHEHLPTARIIVFSVLPRGAQMLRFDSEITTINHLLAENAGASYSFLNAHDAFLCGHRTPCELTLPPTWTHPTEAGYRVLDDLLQRKLAEHP